MDTNQSGQKLNWFQRMRSWLNGYQINFAYMLKNAAGISKFLSFYGIWALLSYVYFLFFARETISNNFFLNYVSATDLLPIKEYSLVLFNSLIAIEFLQLILHSVGFWYLYRFIKSLDPVNPFNNPKSKANISKVAWIIQGFFLLKIIFPLVFQQIPPEILSATTRSAYSNELVMSRFPGHFVNFYYIIIMFFTAIFSQIFKRGINIHNELEEVI